MDLSRWTCLGRVRPESFVPDPAENFPPDPVCSRCPCGQAKDARFFHRRKRWMAGVDGMAGIENGVTCPVLLLHPDSSPFIPVETIVGSSGRCPMRVYRYSHTHVTACRSRARPRLPDSSTDTPHRQGGVFTRLNERDPRRASGDGWRPDAYAPPLRLGRRAGETDPTRPGRARAQARTRVETAP